MAGWSRSPASQRAFVDAELARHGVAVPGEPWWGLIRLAFSSPARTAIVQAQDVLGLGSEARMNLPGSAAGSWRWRMEAGALTPGLAARLREATAEAGRLARAGRRRSAWACVRGRARRWWRVLPRG